MPGRVCGAGVAQYLAIKLINQICAITNRCQLVDMAWIIPVDVFVYLTVLGNLEYFM